LAKSSQKNVSLTPKISAPIPKLVVDSIIESTLSSTPEEFDFSFTPKTIVNATPPGITPTAVPKVVSSPFFVGLTPSPITTPGALNTEKQKLTPADVQALLEKAKITKKQQSQVKQSVFIITPPTDNNEDDDAIFDLDETMNKQTDVISTEPTKSKKNNFLQD